jgi:hypothetical protein
MSRISICILNLLAHKESRGCKGSALVKQAFAVAWQQSSIYTGATSFVNSQSVPM